MEHIEICADCTPMNPAVETGKSTPLRTSRISHTAIRTRNGTLKPACQSPNIIGIDLYGGTRHSTVTALGQVLTPEQIQRRVTGHVSDAFKRYLLSDKNEAVQRTRAVQQIQPRGGKLFKGEPLIQATEITGKKWGE